MKPNVEVQGRCAASSRSVPCNDGLGVWILERSDDMNSERPVFEFHEYSGKVYRIWWDGRTEGFGEGFILNRIVPIVHIAQSLAIKARNANLITDDDYTKIVD